MEKCQICGRNAIVRIGEVWLCEKKECHEKFFSVEEILRKAGITRADKVLGSGHTDATIIDDDGKVVNHEV